MRKLGLVIPVLLAFFVCNTDACDEKEYRKKIVGTWYPVAGANKEYPIEFSKEGKVTLNLPTKVYYGTYTVNDKDIVTVTWNLKYPYTARFTIQKLTDVELVLYRQFWKEPYTFRRGK